MIELKTIIGVLIIEGLLFAYAVPIWLSILIAGFGLVLAIQEFSHQAALKAMERVATSNFSQLASYSLQSNRDWQQHHANVLQSSNQQWGIALQDANATTRHAITTFATLQREQQEYLLQAYNTGYEVLRRGGRDWLAMSDNGSNQAPKLYDPAKYGFDSQMVQGLKELQEGVVEGQYREI